MKYWLDTEFIEEGTAFELAPSLISIGVVAEDGREFYACVDTWIDDDCNEWVRANVLPHLPPYEQRIPPAQLARELIHFIGDEEPEFWGWCCAFDYVTLTFLMGGMEHWPAKWPYYFNDIAQVARTRDDVTLIIQDTDQHNAIADAQFVKHLWEVLHA